MKKSKQLKQVEIKKVKVKEKKSDGKKGSAKTILYGYRLGDDPEIKIFPTSEDIKEKFGDFEIVKDSRIGIDLYSIDESEIGAIGKSESFKEFEIGIVEIDDWKELIKSSAAHMEKNIDENQLRLLLEVYKTKSSVEEVESFLREAVTMYRLRQKLEAEGVLKWYQKIGYDIRIAQKYIKAGEFVYKSKQHFKDDHVNVFRKYSKSAIMRIVEFENDVALEIFKSGLVLSCRKLELLKMKLPKDIPESEVIERIGEIFRVSKDDQDSNVESGEFNLSKTMKENRFHEIQNNRGNHQNNEAGYINDNKVNDEIDKTDESENDEENKFGNIETALLEAIAKVDDWLNCLLQRVEPLFEDAKTSKQIEEKRIAIKKNPDYSEEVENLENELSSLDKVFKKWKKLRSKYSKSKHFLVRTNEDLLEVV